MSSSTSRNDDDEVEWGPIEAFSISTLSTTPVLHRANDPTRTAHPGGIEALSHRGGRAVARRTSCWSAPQPTHRHTIFPREAQQLHRRGMRKQRRGTRERRVLNRRGVRKQPRRGVRAGDEVRTQIRLGLTSPAAVYLCVAFVCAQSLQEKKK